MKKFLKLAATIFMVVALCFSFTLDNAVSAASNSNKQQDRKAMQAFRQSILATAGDTNNVIHQFFIFMLPDVQSELEFNAKVTGHSMDIAGTFGLWTMNDNGKVTDFDIPFYVTQNANNMTIYGKYNDVWKKYSAPSALASLTDIITSPTKEEIDKEVSTVKSVSILQENDNRRTLLVHLDSAKLADEVKAEMAKNPADKGTAEDSVFQEKILGYFDTGLRNADIWYIWKIDKKNHKTGVVIMDLSQVVQETARAVLNDPENQDLPDELKDILETFAFYSEFKSYTTFLGTGAESSVMIPQEVIDNAVETKDVVPDTVPVQ